MGQDLARPTALRRGLALASVTVAYNALEGLIAILAGLAAGFWATDPTRA